MTPDLDAPQEVILRPADLAADGRMAGATGNGPDAIPPENILDQNLDETNVEDALRSRVTINVLASMASLDVVIPGGGTLQGLYDTLFRSKEMNDDFSISNLGGTLEEYFEYQMGEVDQNGQKIKKDDDDDDNTMAGAIREGRERMERQRELEEWTHAEHSYAGLEMTGAEWGEFADELKNDTPLHRWLVGQIKKKENKTDAEAQTEAAKIALLAKMQSVPKDQWTDDMKSLDQELSNNPDERAKYNQYLDDSAQRRGQALGHSNKLESTVADSKQESSVSTAEDSLNARPFPGAPNASAVFQIAASPPAPDDKAPDPSKPTPQVAVASPPPPMPGGNGGFDMS